MPSNFRQYALNSIKRLVKQLEGVKQFAQRIQQLFRVQSLFSYNICKSIVQEENPNKKTLFESVQHFKIYYSQLKEHQDPQEKSKSVSQSPNKVTKQIQKEKKSVSSSNCEQDSPQHSSSESLSKNNHKSSPSQSSTKKQYRPKKQQVQAEYTAGGGLERQPIKTTTDQVVGGGDNSQNNFQFDSEEIEQEFYYEEQVISSKEENHNQNFFYQNQVSSHSQFSQTAIHSKIYNQNMDDHRRHQQMIDEGGSDQNEKQINAENNQGTPVFSCSTNPQALNSFFPDQSDNQNKNQTPSKEAPHEISFSSLKQQSTNSVNSQTNNKGGFFNFQFNDPQLLEDTTNQKPSNGISGLSLNIQTSFKDQGEPKENIPMNTQPLPQQQKKKAFNLFLPVAEISKAEKEIPLQTDGNSQKKKQNVFNFYDNFHEYTVFCDVAMKKCSRENQEDRFQAISPLDTVANNDAFFAVFDGHGTSAIADMVKEKLHTYIVTNQNYPKNIERAAKESFKKIDEEILKKQQDEQICSGGTTALCCLIKEDQIYIINCGDSSSVLVTNDNDYRVLNNLHKPSSKEEQERLTQKNAIFTEQRVVGSLAVTRALGDFKHKEYIISEPDITIYNIDENSKYLFLGTDGFWDIISYKDELPELLKKREAEDSNMKDLSTFLVENASSRKTSQKKDNMTLLAIDLNYYYRQNTEAKENVSVESMSGSNCVMCQKSQYKINTEISSYLFQVKSPHSVGRSTEKRATLNSLSQRQQQTDIKTCNKNSKKRAFFGSENTEEDGGSGNKFEDMGKLDSLLLTQKESIQLGGINLNQNGAQIAQSITEVNPLTMSSNFKFEFNSNQQQNQNANLSPQNKNTFQFPSSLGTSSSNNNSNINNNNSNNSNVINNSNNSNNGNSNNNQVPSKSFVSDKQKSFFQY